MSIKAIQNIKGDIHVQLNMMRIEFGCKLYELTNHFLRTGLKLQNRWDELSDETQAELTTHGIKPF